MSKMNLRKPEDEAIHARELFEAAVERVCDNHPNWTYLPNINENDETRQAFPGIIQRRNGCDHLTDSKLIIEIMCEAAKWVAEYYPKSTHLLDELVELLGEIRQFYNPDNPEYDTYGWYFSRYEDWCTLV